MVRRGLCVGVMSVWLAASGPLWAQEAPQAPSMERQAVLLQEAEALEGAAKYADAAKRYDEIAKRHSNHEVGPRAAVGAVRTWIAAGKIKKAEASAKRVGKLYGGSQLGVVLEAYMLVAAAHHGAPKRDAAAVMRWCAATLKLLFGSIDGEAREKEKTHEAHAKFLLAELERDVWLAAKIKGAKAADLKDALDDKVRGAEVLRMHYEGAMELEDPVWRWAAAFRMVELYELLAQALRESPAPFPAGSEQAQVYREALEQTLRPMERTAHDQYGELIKRAGELGAGEDVWVKRAVERRAALEARLGDAP